MHASLYSAAHLASLPTLCVGQCCSLKIDSQKERVWICRVGGGITVEHYDGGRWDIASGSCTYGQMPGKE